MSFFREKPIKATKKHHRCAWCESSIDSGSSAISWASYHYECDFCSGYMHLECSHAMNALLKESHDYVEFGDYARGRMDDRNGPPQFSPTGERIS